MTGTINVPQYVREPRQKWGCSVEGLQDEDRPPEPHVIKGEKNPTPMKWFSPGVNSSCSCWWLFQLAARIHKAAFRGLCFNNVLLYQLIVPPWPVKGERYTFPRQHHLPFCKKGAAGFWKGGLPGPWLALLKNSGFLSLLQRGGCLCVGLCWITLKPVFCQWYLCGIFNGPAFLREAVGSGSSRGLLLAFLSPAFDQSRNDCSRLLAQDPCQRPVGWLVRAVSSQSALNTLSCGSGMERRGEIFPPSEYP